jgi:hypothetical protein
MLAILPRLMLLLAALSGLTDRAAAEPCADLALVLAVDSSGSIDDGEFALQLDGFAAAFRHPVVLDAMASTGRVDLAAAFWGDPGAPVQIVPWHTVDSRADSARFPDRLAATPRHTYGGTGLGNGVLAALNLLSDPSRCARRSVINVSGDGRATTAKAIQRDAPAGATNQETLLAHAKRLAVSRSVTVNGLTIIDDDPGLTAYYLENVATGPDSFVMEIATLDDFAAAIVAKLRREILSMTVSGTRASARRGPEG